MMTTIQQIKSALRADEYASRYYQIKGGKMLCLWHDERTPSMAVHKEYVKCFGCQKSGDVIDIASITHGISKGRAIAMLAEELGIPLAPHQKQHPYDAAKEQRVRAEAEEWRRLTRLQMVTALDYETSIPFLDDLDSMSRSQVVAVYQDHRTVEMAAFLRQSAVDHAKPTVESLLKEFLQWSR